MSYSTGKFKRRKAAKLARCAMLKEAEAAIKRWPKLAANKPEGYAAMTRAMTAEREAEQQWLNAAARKSVADYADYLKRCGGIPVNTIKP